MLHLIFTRSKEQMVIDTGDGSPKTIWAWNKTRNFANGLRKLHDPHEVVYTEPLDGSNPVPFMPSIFPNGDWEIVGVTPHTPEEPYLYPFFIRTNAHNMTPQWALDAQKGYDHETTVMKPDGNVGLHFSTSSTTLNCIRIAQEIDLRNLVTLVQKELNLGNKIRLTVQD